MPASSRAGDGAAVRVAEVRGRAGLRAFLRLAWRIQRTDPAWVPPLLVERAAFLDPHHPFLGHGAAARLLARRRGEPVGRLLVSADPRHAALHGERAAFFGLFECERDQASAGALLDAAAAWARARGLDRLVGPIDYAIHYQAGLLVEGFEHPPRIMTNHNPPWYRDLLESWGLRPRQDLLAWRLDLAATDGAPPRLRANAARVAARTGVVVRPARLADYHAELARLRAVYNGAWAGTWGFVPMSEEEFAHLGRDLRRLVVPDLLLLAEVRGEPVGMCLVLPDLNEAIRPLDGRLTTLGIPVGLGRLLWRLPRVRAVRLLTVGVLPAWRRRGIAELLMLAAYDAARGLGYRTGEMGWTAADNRLITAACRAFGGEPYKRWRVYARDLATPGVDAPAGRGPAPGATRHAGEGVPA